MTKERPTIRPVNISRLVEVADVCESSPESVDKIKTSLESSKRRAKEVVDEAKRIGFIKESTENPDCYLTSDLGLVLLSSVREENWEQIGELLSNNSPHYAIIRNELEKAGSATQAELLELVRNKNTSYSFNQTSVDIVCDWAERLGDIQKHAFSGRYYIVKSRDSLDAEFDSILLEKYEALEESVGLNVRQHYVSIPRLREHVCEEMHCTRDAFDTALVSLVDCNIGKLELTGAPRDTSAKDAILGIKRIETPETEEIVTTIQSTDRVLSGVEYRNKQYYYLVDHQPRQSINHREYGEKR